MPAPAGLGRPVTDPAGLGGSVTEPSGRRDPCPDAHDAASALRDVWRREAPHVLAALVRRYRDFDRCEDAAAQALVDAAAQWPVQGVPDNPRGWLITVAARRMIDALRADSARSAREQAAATLRPQSDLVAPAADQSSGNDRDDTLPLLLLCCHPALSRPTQVALTLRAVAGLSTAQIAAGLLIPESTAAQRISRAKAKLREAGARFSLPTRAELPERVATVLTVLLLIFNEGYTRSSGDALIDDDLTAQAVRLTRQLATALPDDDEVGGALALMLLTGSHSAARVDARGDLIPLADQDRTSWDRTAIAEGVTILERVLPRGRVGPLQLQAAIAAVHAEAPSFADTDWQQIRLLYTMLDSVAPSPAVTLNHAVALAMTDGPDAGLLLIEPLLTGTQLRDHHRLHAVRAHLLEQAARVDEAAAAFTLAARLTASIPEQRYLLRRAAALAAGISRSGAGADRIES